MRRCISLQRPAPPVRLSCDARGFPPPHEKIRGWGPTPVEPGFLERPGYVRGAPARRLQLFGPTAQHQQASSRATATLATLLCLPASSMARRLSTSLLTPALACLRAAVFVDYLPFGQASRRPRRSFVVPGGLDEQLSGACCRPWLSCRGIATTLLSARGHEPHHAAKPRRRRTSRSCRPRRRSRPR